MESTEAAGSTGQPAREEHTDFFISYTSADQHWAEWIACELERAGYQVIIQAWDFRPGANFIAEMDQAARLARRTIAVLSERYLESDYAFTEWATALHDDPRGQARKLVPIRVRPCEVKGLLGSIIFIDLVNLDEASARRRLLEGVGQQRHKPSIVSFPPASAAQEWPTFPAVLPALWNVPYLRNPLFTGREELLKQLASALHSGQITAPAQPQAISGMGGVGKTQLAVEYAYRHAQEYKAVLWSQADSREALLSGYVVLAGLLGLPERNEPEQIRAVEAVRHWLATHDHWLLILDNADEPELLRDFLPDGSGHVLLTTRAQSPGGQAQSIEVEKMGEEQSALFLLRRAGLIGPNDTLTKAMTNDITEAKALARDLGGLPLALDQAGTYIEEIRCSLADYRAHYQTEREALLRRRGGEQPDHPESVTVTFRLAFAKVERRNVAAAYLLRLCALLASEAIPEEIITQGADHLGPNLAPVGQDRALLDEAIAALSAYSLLRRDIVDKTLVLHRLVQAVLRDEMDQQSYQRWAERAVRAVNAAFPDVEFATWPQCERLLPHALACAELIAQERMTFVEAARLLNKAGYYLYARGRYASIEPLFQQALAIREQQSGSEHPDTAQSLNALGRLYYSQGKYEQAEPLFRRALAIYEQQLGPEHPDTATSLNNLAMLYQAQGKYEQAEPLFRRALEISEQQLGPGHPDTATSLNNLATLYQEQGRYAEAEPLYQRTLAISEQQLGPEHPDTATSVSNLGMLYYAMGRYEWAEQLLQRALTIFEQQLGPEHPLTATSLNNLASLYQEQGKYEQAESLYRRALEISERQLGPEHPDTVASLNNLATHYSERGKYKQAEELMRRALEISERQLGPEHPHTAASLNNLAGLYLTQGKYRQAEPLYRRALAIEEQQLGSQHPDTAMSLDNLGKLYQEQGRYAEADQLIRRALEINEQQLGPEHPNTAASLHNLGRLYRTLERYKEAEPLLRRALAINGQQLGAEHPLTARNLNELGRLYREQGRYAEAEPLIQRALSAFERQLGPEHPLTADSRGNLGMLYYAQSKDWQAEPLLKGALVISEQQLGPEHPQTAECLTNLARLYYRQGRYTETEPLLGQALTILERQLGPEHPRTVVCLCNLARLYCKQGRYDQAENLLRQSRDNFIHTLGWQHPTTIEVSREYADLLRRMGRKWQALRVEAELVAKSGDIASLARGAGKFMFSAFSHLMRDLFE